MTMQLVKKAALLGLALLVACVSPVLSASSLDRQSIRLANIIAEELPPNSSLALFDISRHIIRLSRDYQVDPLLVLAIIKVESDFKPRATSNVGAIGLMQLMPIVVREVGNEVKVASRNDLFDPYKNILLGIHYFTYLREKYRNNLQNTLMAYNIGPSALDELIVRQDEIPQGYYQKVMKFYERFRKRMVSIGRVAEFI